MTDADTDLLALYRDTYSQWRCRAAALQALDLTADVYCNVAVTVEKARDQMRLVAAEFGMIPSSRSRMHVAAPQEAVDPFQAWLAGKA